MLSYANLTKSVNKIRKFCSVLISCWNRTEQNMKSMFMRWNQIFILWDETESNSYFMKWDRIKFSFCKMRWDQIFFCEMRQNRKWKQLLWNEIKFLWNRTSHSDSSVSLIMFLDINKTWLMLFIRIDINKINFFYFKLKNYQILLFILLYSEVIMLILL